MNAADIYLSALNNWQLAKNEAKQERSPMKGPKPMLLDGGCLLFRLHGRSIKQKQKQKSLTR